jgi:SAM-dependent methyltransferase
LRAAETVSSRSFRDPCGFVVRIGGRILRIVTEQGKSDYLAFESSPTIGRMIREGSMVPTTRPAVPGDCQEHISEVFEANSGSLLLEHEPISFPSLPYEWPAGMLHAAAALTIDLAIQLADEGLGLKDATPYNVMFRGPSPVFLDVLSVERRDPGDPIWLAEAQFVRSFLLPLAMCREFGMSPGEFLLANRDGLEPESVYRWLSGLQRLRSPWLSLVSIPAWLSRSNKSQENGLYRKKLLPDQERARYVLTARLKSLRRALAAVQPKPQSSTWSGYMCGNNNYSKEQFTWKETFVADAIRQHSPKRLLDVGCNNGYFSRIAARQGAETIAIDLDPVVVGQVWKSALEEKLNILPLVVNLSRPTPAVGWNNQECESFLDRARGRFDFVLMLAVLHHMIVTERIPLDEVLDTAADLTSGILLIEYVGPEDSMFRRLTRGRDELHRDFTVERFEAACRKRFQIIRSMALEGSARRLYLLRRNA